MFSGKYERTLDQKRRLMIPPKYRHSFSDSAEQVGFHITVGLDPCLTFYTPKRWNELLQNSIQQQSFPSQKSRNFIRNFLGQAEYCELDKQHRILLPTRLLESVGIAEEVVLAGVGDHIELWDAEKFHEWESKLSAEGLEQGAQELNR